MMIIMGSLCAWAQTTLTVKFTAVDETGHYCPFDYIEIENATRGWTSALSYPDTVMILHPMGIGVGEITNQSLGLGTAYPNPFNGKTNIPFNLSEASEVCFKVFRADGRATAEQNMHLEAGSHSVSVGLTDAGLAFLEVITPQGKSVTKLVCTGDSGNDAIEVSTLSTATPEKAVSSSRGDFPPNYFLFYPGDMMYYRGKHFDPYVESIQIKQHQNGNETVTLHFVLNTPTGALPKWFSVSDDKQVFFSQGNLRYRTYNSTFGFSEHQYDYAGNDNLSNAEDHWIDLFGWGTSGYQHGAIAWQPTNFSTTRSDFYAYGDPMYNLYDQTGEADWGYHPIWNGGNTEDMWRTLSSEEWNYLLNERQTNSGFRYAKAQVNDVNGLIVYPDFWRTNAGELLIPNRPNDPAATFSSNVISGYGYWEALESEGAVFLPMAGWRVGSASVQNAGTSGYYHSSSRSGDEKSVKIRIDNSKLETDYPLNRPLGCAVRLVRDVDATPTLPTVTTKTVTDITPFSAKCSYSVDGDGCLAVTARGVCWSSTNPSPTISNDHTNQGTGGGTGGQTFTSQLTDLTPNTIYYVRAYATNAMGTSYGTAETFTSAQLPTGAIGATYTINVSGDVVLFSKGNLQYKASTNTWRFAENQSDYIGRDNQYISSTYNNWIDLFCWGTSGYNHGAVCYQPWSTSTTTSDYYAYGNPLYNLERMTGKADWGYNAISNGGNTENQWHTLTNEEWDYVFKYRETPSGIRYAVGRINNVCGVILLPDNWDESYYSLNIPNTYYASYNSNVFDDTQWSTMEAHGAVFLPAAGLRQGTSVDYDYINEWGMYWTSQVYSSSPDEVGVRKFYNGSVGTGAFTAYRSWGCSVRLVYRVQ